MSSSAARRIICGEVGPSNSGPLLARAPPDAKQQQTAQGWGPAKWRQ